MRKLLWKDRVFYVRIDGFDELMAEINSKLNKAEPPIDSSYLNEKKNKLITQLISNPYLINTKCKYIQNDFEKLNKTKEHDIVSSFFKFMSKKDENEGKSQSGFFLKAKKNEKLSEEEEKYLRDLNQELFSNNFKYACSIIESKIDTIDKDRQFYSNLLESKAKCLRNLRNTKEAIKCYTELIRIDKKDIKNYILLSDLLENFKDKLEYLERAIELDPFYAILYYKKAKLLHKHYDENIEKEKLHFDLDEIIAITDKCCEVDPSINNPVWGLKFDLIKKKYDNNTDISREYTQLLERLEKQDKYYPQVVNKKTELFKLNKEKPEIAHNYIIDCIDKTDSSEYVKHYELILLEEYANNNNIDLLKTRIEYIENKYEINNEYLERKAEYQLEKFDDLQESLITLKKIKSKDNSIYTKLFYYLIYNNELPEAEVILKENLGSDKYKYVTLLEAKNEYQEALKIIQEIRANDLNNHTLCVRESFLLLKTEQFQTAYNFLKKCLKPSNYTDPYFLINYFIASKKFKGSLKIEKVKEKILNGSKHNDTIEAAAYALLGDEKNAYSKLCRVLKNNHSMKYDIRDWIVFEDVFKTDRFKELIGTN